MTEDKLEKIIEQICELTVLELNDLVKRLEEKLGVKAIQFSAPQQVAQEEEDEKETNDNVTVILKDAGTQRIQEVCDNVPSNIKEDILQAEAEDIKTKIQEVGGVVEIK